MNKIALSLLAAALLASTAPALAADLPMKAVAAVVPAAAPTTTLTFEASPEFYALASSPHAVGDLNDWYAKGSIGVVVAPGWTIGGSIQDSLKPTATSGTYVNGLYVGQVEGTIAYKFKLNDQFSVTGTGGLGFAWGNTGYVGGAYSSSGSDLGNNDDSFGYYFVQAALDYKLDSHWTWNVINARYRNSFNETWITPKVSTGVTYNIDATDAVYANVGYAWKDKGSSVGMVADKYNVAVGYKYSF